MIKLKQGVSLIVLVITIAIMLIIASVVLMNLESNNIINSAEETVDKSNLSVTKEKIEILASRELLETQTTKLTQTGLDTRLKTEFGENNYELYNAEEFYIVKHNDKSFKVYPNSEVEEYLEGEIVIIDSIEDLVRFREDVNSGIAHEKSAILIKDIDFKDDASYDNTPVTIAGVEYKLGGTNDLKTHLTTGVGWEAIGVEAYYFKGTFDGTNKKIQNIYVNTNKIRQGLFGWVSGSIKNVILTGNMTTSSYIIGLVADFRGKTIENCINHANITSTLLNRNDAAVGGIVGWNYGEIVNCENYGIIKAASNCVGGIAGVNYSLVKMCINNGEMYLDQKTGQYRSGAGGIVGYSDNGTIDSCINYAKIESNMGYTSGILGSSSSNSQSIIKLSCNYAEVTSTDDGIGGIVGSAGLEALIENCYNVGNINGNDKTGGIAGRCLGVIKNTYNAGNIVANNLADGIVGTLADETGVVYGSVENSYYLNTSVTNGTNIGTPKTIKEMKTREFAKLLGIPTWKYVEVKNNNYPVLSWQ